MTTAISLHIGLNSVDPASYQGWHGPLRACENDARDMEQLARSRGFKTQLLLTQDCTREAVGKALETAGETLLPGDFFMFTASCHGGQLRDVSGDEPDALDETLCLYDGEWLDDETHAMLTRFARGVRVVLGMDACHSATLDKDRGMPADVAAATAMANRDFYKRVAFTARAQGQRRPVSASTITLSACRDDQTAADGESNGLFTATLKRVWSNGGFNGDYLDFYRAIRDRMPPTQVPTINAEGERAREFLHQQPFTITEGN